MKVPGSENVCPPVRFIQANAGGKARNPVSGSWGIFQLEASVACAKGTFKFNSSGSWDKSGFHGAGVIQDNGRSGDFEQAKGRIAQIGSSIVPAATAGTYDVTYELVVDRMDK